MRETDNVGGSTPRRHVRWVVAHKREGDLHWSFFDPSQGRHTYATAAEAQTRADGFLAHPEQLQSVGVDPLTLRALPVECWPTHHDPKGWPYTPG